MKAVIQQKREEEKKLVENPHEEEVYFDCKVLDKLEAKLVFDKVVEKPPQQVDQQFDLLDFISKSDFSSLNNNDKSGAAGGVFVPMQPQQPQKSAFDMFDQDDDDIDDPVSGRGVPVSQFFDNQMKNEPTKPQADLMDIFSVSQQQHQPQHQTY